jgi:hypothetical protein
MAKVMTIGFAIRPTRKLVSLRNGCAHTFAVRPSPLSGRLYGLSGCYIFQDRNQALRALLEHKAEMRTTFVAGPVHSPDLNGRVPLAQCI